MIINIITDRLYVDKNDSVQHDILSQRFALRVCLINFITDSKHEYEHDKSAPYDDNKS